ncbi:hypothetical protein GCM10017083_06740 [Thalassobaculum fulvum]|uniref:Uncharacterized protein n=1 Tax=Thalassobaculum fulvum TaxID=1633335 RepID=A0A918XNS3_9PROT|nr:hypothetical protein [Thalassobaculum fulvum]GHD42122.1 hypothetical protein GCM10017083_06740 [Thalassobaculum fulvum]
MAGPMSLRIAALLFLAMTAVARADPCGPQLIVDFVEDVSDHFILMNASEPGWTVRRVEIDLRASAGRLIFDVSESGAGVSSWRPYAQAGGTAVAVGHTEVTDGDSLLTVAFARFDPGERFLFTIDLDDTLPEGTQTWVDGAEIAGGRVNAVFAGPDGSEVERSAPFEPDSRADTGRGESCLVS